MSPNRLRKNLLLGAGLLTTALLIVVLARAYYEEPKKEPPAPPPAPEKKADAQPSSPSPLGLLLPDVQRVREAAARAQSANNLRQIGIAAQNYAEQQPKEGKPTSNAFPPYSNGMWPSILPFIEQNNLYQYQPLTYGITEPEARLGAQLGPVGDVLRSQLDLGKDRGQVLFQLTAGGSAEKAGLKRYDIFLELNGSAVSSDPAAFTKALKDIKEGTKIKAVVLRGGKRTEVKDLVLGKAGAATTSIKTYLCPSDPVSVKDGSVRTTIQDGTSNTIMIGERGGWGWAPPPTKERFTSRHQEGSLVITIIGTVTDGKAQPQGIKIQEGTVVERYTSLDKVPAKHRDKVAQMLKLSTQETKQGSEW